MKVSIKTILSVLAMALVLPVYAQAQSGNAPGVTQIVLFEYDGDEATLAENPSAVASNPALMKRSIFLSYFALFPGLDANQ